LTALHRACYEAKIHLVEFLLKEGADINCVDNQGSSPLHWSCFTNGKPEIVELLLKHNADPNLCDIDNRTPLLIASHKGYLSIVKQLILHGAELDSRDNHGWTALHYACLNRNLDIVKYLILKGANFTITSTVVYTSKHMQSYKPHLTAIEIAEQAEKYNSPVGLVDFLTPIDKLHEKCENYILYRRIISFCKLDSNSKDTPLIESLLAIKRK